MKKFNNKGFTIVEILVTFVIAATITISMYVSIANLKNRKTIASYKSSAKSYIDILEYKINDNIIAKHLISAIQNNNKITFTFKDGSTKDLIINQNNRSISSNPTLCKDTSGNIISDSIEYDNDVYTLPNMNLTAIKNSTTGACETINNFVIDGYEFSNSNKTLALHISLFHPDLGNKYSINIVAPIGE